MTVVILSPATPEWPHKRPDGPTIQHRRARPVCSFSEEEAQVKVGVDNSVHFTLTLNDNEIIEDVLGKEKDDVEKGEDEDEDDTQAEKVTRKEAADTQKICQAMFIYFST